MIHTSLGMASPASLFVSALGAPLVASHPIHNTNSTAMVNAYQHQIDQQAILREYLIDAIEQLPITSTNIMKMQASSLAQLTESTNELTRNSLVRLFFDTRASFTNRVVQIKAAERCRTIASSLAQTASEIPFDDVQLIAQHLAQCASNMITVYTFSLARSTIRL
jgi:phosphatidylserine/phosphatidylglycerophosphate/cardiolipin synthase-like enzyme